MSTSATLPPPANTAPPPQSKLSVLSIRRGPIPQPRRDLVHGPEGIGKTTFAASYPGVVFLPTEDGTNHLDVARFPQPRTWAEVMEPIDSLLRDQHDFKTLAIDTIDWLEPLVWADVCRRGNKPDIEAFGYGKGYVAALDTWRVFLARLSELQLHKNMSIVMLAHTQAKKFDNPLGDPYDRYILKLHEKAAGLLKEWSRFVGFATFEAAAVKTAKTHTIGVSTGARIMHTTHNAAWDAKNREGLPPVVPFSYDEFMAAVALGAPAAVEQMQAKIRELLPRLAADKQAAITAFLKTGTNATDPVQLARVVDRIEGLLAIAEAGAAPSGGEAPVSEQGGAT